MRVSIILSADTGHFETDLKRAARAAERESKAVQRHLKGIQSQSENLASTIKRVFAFVGAGLIFKQIIANTIEAEKVLRNMERVFNGVGNASGFTAEQVSDYASALERGTIFAGTAIKAGATLLTQFQNIRGEIYTRTIKAVLDLSAATGKDLSSAFQEVGVAINQPVRGLKTLQSLGVAFTDDQKKQFKQLIETGEGYKAQALLLDALEQRFSGAAEAATGTFGGALQQLKNTIGNLLEGDSKGLNGVVTAIQNLNTTLNDPGIQQGFRNLIAGMVGVIEKSAQFVSGLSIVFGRKGGNEIVDLDLQIEDAEERIETLKGRLSTRNPIKWLLFDREHAEKELAAQEAKVAAARARQRELLNGGGKPGGTSAPAPSSASDRPFSFTAGGSGATVKENAAIRAALGEIEAASIRLKAQLEADGAELDRRLARNLISFRNFYDQKSALELKSIEQEIAARRASISVIDEEIRVKRANGKEIGSLEQNRIKTLGEIQALESRGAEVSKKAAFDIAEAYKDLDKTLAGIRTQIQSMRGDSVGAALSGFDSANADLISRLMVEGNTQGIQDVQTLRQLNEASERLNELKLDEQDIKDRLAETTRRIVDEQQLGLKSELDASSELGKAREEAISQLDQIYQKMLAIAGASGMDKQVEEINKLRGALGELRNETELAAARINSELRSSFESAFADFLKGTKTAKEAFAAFGESIVNEIAKIAAQAISTKLFSGLFGGTGGIGGFLTGLFGGGRASGGPVMGGRAYLVGERGPEIMVPNSAGTVVPNHALTGQAPNVTIHNYSGQKVTTRRRGNDTDAIIGDVVAGGPLSEALQATYGLQRIGT